MKFQPARNTRRVMAIALLGVLGAACSRGWNKQLPSSAELGSPRGYRIARTIMHMHSPASWDACDRKGSNQPLTDNPGCLAHAREAFCLNRIDVGFMTDHPNFMSTTEFSDLLMLETAKGDTPIEALGQTVASRMRCSTPSGQSPIVAAGFEDRTMALGMSKHYGPTADDRGIYLSEDATSVSNLKSVTGAVMAVPHIESRSVALLESLGVDALEVYNFHSNLDPNIRSQYLNRSDMDYIFDFLNYWMDPYYRQEPDLSLFSFFEISDVILGKWQQTWSDGYTMSAFAASDSHENVLPMTAPDGERLDAHRRLLRWVSNHWLVPEISLDAVKTAIRAGRGWFAVEAFGSPVGMDFTASATTSDVSTRVGVGEKLKIRGRTATVRVELPTLHAQSPGAGATVERKAVLKRIVGASSVVVAESTGQALEVAVSEPGIYRAEVYIRPTHLKNYLFFDTQKSDQLYLWVFTNPIRLADEDP